MNVRLSAIVAIAAVGYGVIAAAARPQQFKDFRTPAPLAPGNTLIIGFLGGWEPWDNDHRLARKLALRIRAMNLPGVYVETVENHRRALARELVIRAWDRNGDGRLDATEQSAIKLILYGQSFGGAAVVKLAQELEPLAVPVLLTVQVDSIGRGDDAIPPNVRAAANFFQHDGFPIRGRSRIVPRDGARTKILFNRQFNYSGKKVDLSGYAWYQRWFRAAHTKMDADPDVWTEVERLILSELNSVFRK